MKTAATKTTQQQIDELREMPVSRLRERYADSVQMWSRDQLHLVEGAKLWKSRLHFVAARVAVHSKHRPGVSVGK
ncbi:MAG: hypothetical protein K2Q20_14495, partial [Phycisphaerales bacterium]|nr:hypothetical protein [Phycisphaerales bacterium]